ncbi:MAG: hypothetical protein JWR48_2619 [Mycobacterium sp.]|nr:hypothetical protein [Mycobacterium sp.]
MRSGFGSHNLLALGGGDYTKRSFSERRAAPVEVLADSGSSSIAFPRRDFDVWKRLVEGAGHGETWELTKFAFFSGRHAVRGVDLIFADGGAHRVFSVRVDERFAEARH